jgi:hypothetical protein
MYWTANFSFAGGSGPVKIWSANNIAFTSQGWNCKDYFSQFSTSLVVKLNLSKWIYAFNWKPCPGYAYCSDGNTYEWRYSVDGIHWSVAQSMGVWGGGNFYPTDRFISVPDTKTLYLGYFGTFNGAGYTCINDQYNVADVPSPMYFWCSSGPAIPGDANKDGKVDVSDLGILAANYGVTSGATWSTGDFNGDGKVDVSDLGILAANYGTGTGTALSFNTDAASLGLSAGKEEAPVTSLLGCGPVGIILMAMMGLMAGSLRKDEPV